MPAEHFFLRKGETMTAARKQGMLPSVKELSSKISVLKDGEFYTVGTVSAWIRSDTWWVQMKGGGVQFSKTPEAAARKMLVLIKYDRENPFQST